MDKMQHNMCTPCVLNHSLLHVQVALVGAPNVGKSSLVNVLSSGVPEVCDYPFTTRSIKMGHFYVNGQRHQVQLSATVHTCEQQKTENVSMSSEKGWKLLIHQQQPLLDSMKCALNHAAFLP